MCKRNAAEGVLSIHLYIECETIMNMRSNLSGLLCRVRSESTPAPRPPSPAAPINANNRGFTPRQPRGRRVNTFCRTIAAAIVRFLRGRASDSHFDVREHLEWARDQRRPFSARYLFAFLFFLYFLSASILFSLFYFIKTSFNYFRWRARFVCFRSSGSV